MVFDLDGIPKVPLGFLSVLQTGGGIDTYIGVPQAVARQFSISKNPAQFWQKNISRYHELFLLNGSKCPLQLETGGALWTK